MKISELNDIQRQHLAWRLENSGLCGLVGAMTIASGKTKTDYDLVDLFISLGKSNRSAKILQTKIKNFKL